MARLGPAAATQPNTLLPVFGKASLVAASSYKPTHRPTPSSAPPACTITATARTNTSSIAAVSTRSQRCNAIRKPRSLAKRVALSPRPRPVDDDVEVPSFRRRVKCGKCGGRDVDVRPNWNEQPKGESLTGK